MAMTLETMREVLNEACVFIEVVSVAIGRLKKAIEEKEKILGKESAAEEWLTITSKETAALRRASMELTRALARLRTSNKR